MRAMRLHLLPAGEGGRYGRMRVTGPSMGHVFRRGPMPKPGPSSAPSGHLLPGGEGTHRSSALARPRHSPLHCENPRCASPLSLVAGLVLAASSPVATADEHPSYRVLGSDQGKVAIVDPTGEVAWEVGNPSEVHDLAMLPNGNVMFTTSGPKVVEMTPEKEIVW